MSISDYNEHLSIIGNMNKISSLAPLAANTAGKTFRSAIITKFSQGGDDKATIAALSLENVQFTKEGSIVGGEMTSSVATPDNRPVSSTVLSLGKEGKASAAVTRINNKRGDGLFKTVSSDISGVNWTEDGRVGSGQIQIMTVHPKTGLKRTSGSLNFEKERLSSGTFNHHSSDAVISFVSSSEVDYTNLKCLGLLIVGGSMTVVKKTAKQAVSSSSQLFFAERGLGRIERIEAVKLDTASGEIKRKTSVDYTGVSYNPRNEILAGDILYNITDKDDNVVAQTRLTFDNEVPLTSKTLRFDGKSAKTMIVTDYSNSKFNNENKVVGSTAEVSVYHENKQHVTKTVYTYDEDGKIIDKKTTTSRELEANPMKEVDARDFLAPSPQSVKAATQNSRADIYNPAGDARQTVAAGGQINAKTETVKRADGTLERTTTINSSADGAPVSALITVYDTDGATVIKTYDIDLSAIGDAGGSGDLTGSVLVREFIGGTVPRAESVFSY